MADMIGKWVNCPKMMTGFEEFHTALGSTPEAKELWRYPKFSMEISQDGDKWQLVMDFKGIPGVKVYTFTPGEPFTFESLDGKKNMRCVITVHADKFTERVGIEQDDGSYKEWDIVTVREGEKLKMTHTFQGAVMVTKMKKIGPNESV